MIKQFSWVILMAAAVQMTACAVNKSTETSTGGETVTVKTGDFKAINNSTAATVHFTQSPECSVKFIEGDNITTTISAADGVLYIKQKRRNNNKNNRKNVEIWLTAPVINEIKNSGVIRLNAKKIESEDFALINSGVSSITTDMLNCGLLRYENKGISKIMGNIKCRNMNINNSGALKDSIKVDCDSSNIKNNGAIKDGMSITGHGMLMDNSGSLNTKISFNGDSFRLKNNGVGNMSVSVDVKHLNIENSGSCNIKVSGNADDSNINSTGVAKVDTSKLNKY